MRRQGRTDANQSQIVRDLRKLGHSVWITSGCGEGAPDIVVGKNGRNFMFEIKDPNQPPSKRKLTDDERAFHCAWIGQVAAIETTEGALAIIGHA